jgi:hypothetical protein
LPYHLPPYSKSSLRKATENPDRRSLRIKSARDAFGISHAAKELIGIARLCGDLVDEEADYSQFWNFGEVYDLIGALDRLSQVLRKKFKIFPSDKVAPKRFKCKCT